MAAAAALARQTEGVERVVNGLNIGAEFQRQPQLAPVASPKPAAYVADRARLVARAPLAPIAPVARPDHRRLISTPDLTGRSRIQSKQSAGETRMASAPRGPITSTPPLEPAVPEAHISVESLRRPAFDADLAGFSATAQKACYLVTSSPTHVTDLHMAATLAGVAEPALLPDESAVSAGEAFVSDGAVDEPARLEANPEAATTPSATVRSLDEHVPLIQSTPEPTRRAWVSGLREHGLTTMRASVDR